MIRKAAAYRCAIAALLLALAGRPALAADGPPPTPAPTDPQTRNFVDVEAGGGNSWLNNGRGTWNEAYLSALFAWLNGVRLYTRAGNSVRFGGSDDAYEFELYVPTKGPKGVVNLSYGFSPQHYNLPQTSWGGEYDLRAGGGYGYQASYVNRAYTSADARNYAVGADHYYGNQRLAYRVTLVNLSNTPGVGFSQSLSWATYLPSDVLTISATAGREVEDAGLGRVAEYGTATLYANETHWLDARTAIHVIVGYNVLQNAYNRFESSVGLRVRL